MTLRPHPDNPRYFADETGAPVLLVGSHTWANFATDQGGTRFDYEGYLDFLVAHGHNFFRGWNWDPPFAEQGFNGGPFEFTPSPWLRTGPGLATDGKPKFDLTQWNEEYFARVRARVLLAAERGIYVAVMLFQGFAWQFNRTDVDGFAYDGRNNVNDVDGGPGWGASTLDHPAVIAAQEAYVRKLVDTVGDLDTVLWEIANEAGPYSTAWHEHFIALLHSLTDGPVGFTFQFDGGSNDTLAASSADWISPDCEPELRAAPPVADGSKVVVFDTDHGYDWRSLRADGPDGWRAWAWKCALQGNNLLFMDPYLARITIAGEVRNAPVGEDPAEPYFGLEPDPFWDPLRDALGAVRRVLSDIDLSEAVPHPELSTTRYCLASPGWEYVAWGTEPFEVDLEAASYDASWHDPADGSITWTFSLIAPGGPFAFTPMDAAVLVLRRR